MAQPTPNIAVEQRKREGESQANRKVREYTRTVTINTNSLVDESSILGFAGVPQRWDAHPIDTVARCIHVRPEQDKTNPYIWYLTCQYSTDYTLEDFDDPVYTLPELSWEIEERQVPVPGLLKTKEVRTTTTSKTGVTKTNVQIIAWVDFCRNSAGDIFDPPPMYDKADPVLCIEIITSVFDSQTAMLFNNAVNSDVFLGADPNQVRCKILAKRFQWRDQFRWRLTYRFAYRAEGWQPQILDCGYHYRAADGADPTAFHDDEGNPKIGLLDGHGKPLVWLTETNDDNHANHEPSSTPVWLQFTAYSSIPFAPLNIQQILNRTPSLNQQ